MKKQVLDLIFETRLVAVIRLDDLSQAVKLSEALLKAGVKVQEYTLSNPHALEVIAVIKNELKDFSNGKAIIGAGSVLTAAQALSAIRVGADFIVSPIIDAGVIKTCRNAQVVVLPGAFSPTEIMQAVRLGADLVKLFPAQVGGPQYLRDILAPMPHLKIVPTGGINISNMTEYLAAGAVAVGVGSSLLDKSAIAKGDWEAVTIKAAHFLKEARLL